MKKLKVATVFLMCSMILACASTSGGKKTELLYKNSVTKNLHKKEVKKLYGNPSYEWSLPDGRSAQNYILTKSKRSILSFIPIVFYFSSSYSENYEVVLTYDEKDVVKSVKKFHSKIKSKNDGVCSYYSDIDSCISKVM